MCLIYQDSELWSKKYTCIKQPRAKAILWMCRLRIMIVRIIEYPYVCFMLLWSFINFRAPEVACDTSWAVKQDRRAHPAASQAQRELRGDVEPVLNVQRVDLNWCGYGSLSRCAQRIRYSRAVQKLSQAVRLTGAGPAVAAVVPLSPEAQSLPGCSGLLALPTHSC